MNIKNILSIIVALVIAWFAVKVLWWVFTGVLTMAFFILQIAFVVAIAIPIYIVVRRKLLS